MFAHPAHLGRGVSGEQGVAGCGDARLLPSHCRDYLRALLLGCGVAPELDRGQHPADLVYGNETVLLARDADRDDLLAQLGTQFREACADRFQPPVPQLLAGAIVFGDHLQRRAHAGHHVAAFCVVGQQLDALRTQIYSCMEAHGMPL